MLSRTLSVDEDGRWIDHITWTDMETARKAAALVMADPSSQPFMTLIDPVTVQLRHAHIRHDMMPE